MVNARKLGLVGRIFLAVGAAGCLGGCVGEEGGFIDPYAVAGAGLKAGAGLSESPGAGAATYAFGEAVSTTGNYNANQRAAQAGATNVYVNENENLYSTGHVIGENPVVAQSNIPPQNSSQNSPQITKYGVVVPKGAKVSPYNGYPEVYFCIGCFDADGDGHISAGEYTDIKTNFRSSENLMFVSWWTNSNDQLAGKNIILEVSSLDTGKSYDNQPYHVVRRVDETFSIYTSNTAREVKDYLGGTNFKAIWKVNGMPAKVGEFTIE